MANSQILVPPKIMKALSNWDKLVFEQSFIFGLSFEHATKKIKEAEAKVNEAATAQQNLNTEVKKGEKLSSKFSGALGAIKAAYNGMKFIADVSIIPAAKQQNLENVIQSKIGDPEVGSAMFEKFKQDALKSGADVNKTLGNSISFMNMTTNSDEISTLNGYAERLSKLSSTGKSSGDAASAIMSAMQGDTSSLAKEFKLPETNIKQFSKEVTSSKGNFGAFLASMDQLLQKSGMTEEALQKMMDSPMSKWQKMLGYVNNSFIQIGSGALESIMPILDIISSAFESGAFEPFFNILNSGLALLAQGFLWIAEMIPSAWEFIKATIAGVGNTIWNLITIFMGLIPVIALVGVFFAALNAGLIMGKVYAYAFAAAQTTMAMITNVVTGAMRIFNMVIKANPLMLLISLVIAAMAAFGAWKVVTLGLKQIFSNVFGFIVDLAQNTVNTVINLINGIIKGVNAVAGFFGKVLGVDTKQISEIEYKADFTNFKENGKDFIEDFSMDTFKDSFMPDKSAGKNNEDLLEQYNIGKTGYDVTMPKTTPTPAMPGMSSMPAMSSAPIPVAPAGGSIDSIGQVDNSVDVASEDLKVMRDLAEVNAISNMITLTPTVQMTTGDINSGADLDTIMSRINRTLEEQFVSSAEGVYL
ncbi:hypothetical protein C7121_11750 [Paenibacillus glucanolyticus]|jgi:hypothetical protein|uniref:hypothetical protein n=1 Tax=Paenibacillus TaxID=44249 RepID=UPI0003E2956C|nr:MULTISPECIES: hypothetical protein [Paenibacillus]ANA79312.1 hypothetical protein A3958_04575 [Paenibacillus glucanolyticus]AVV56744.1 hypothetical protein C7121_11750 [Paenibacillus glucanolyticus]ETT37958.1 hypothetical protein C169_13889 [Paenibacillus sp. FSL R5-808]MPY18663.1 hypothetical protein [Paenibacillus glucanolyticus]